MSLDFNKLENLRWHGKKMIARCPACAEAGNDKSGEHLLINKSGHFGCVVHSGKGLHAHEHRKRIWQLAKKTRFDPVIRIQKKKTISTPTKSIKSSLIKHSGTAGTALFDPCAYKGELLNPKIIKYYYNKVTRPRPKRPINRVNTL